MIVPQATQEVIVSSPSRHATPIPAWREPRVWTGTPAFNACVHLALQECDVRMLSIGAQTPRARTMANANKWSTRLNVSAKVTGLERCAMSDVCHVLWQRLRKACQSRICVKTEVSVRTKVRHMNAHVLLVLKALTVKTKLMNVLRHHVKTGLDVLVLENIPASVSQASRVGIVSLI